MKNLSFSTLRFFSTCIVIGFLSACSDGSSSSGSPSANPTVQTSVGVIQGLERSYTSPVVNGKSLTYSVYEYRGIPFAQALTQNDRWGLAKPSTTLGPEIFKAYEFAAACPQQARFDLT